MPYITQEEYQTLANCEAPEDFAQLLAYAESIVDAHTLFAFVNRSLASLPSVITERLKLVCALQVQHLAQLGGLSALGAAAYSSANLGSFSYSLSSEENSHSLAKSVQQLTPLLVAYARSVI